MKIHNIRLNKAMNSSSTHSLLLLRDPSEMISDSKETKNLQFGWEHWTAASEEAKHNYLGIAIHANLRQQFPEDIALIITKETFGINLTEKDGDFYIDHQSEWTLPWNFDETMLHEGFIKEFKKFLSRREIVILGGNDNDHTSHPLSFQGKEINLGVPLEEHHGRQKNERLIARKDPKYDYWVLFNRSNGAKIRMSFNEI